MARKIHKLSKRNKYPFVVLNGALLDVKKYELELFGEEKNNGSISYGSLEKATGGTLLIDEIGKLDPNTTAPDIFQDNVKRIRARYQRVIDNIKKEVSEKKIRELGLGALLGTTTTSSGKVSAGAGSTL